MRATKQIIIANGGGVGVSRKNACGVAVVPGKFPSQCVVAADVLIGRTSTFLPPVTAAATTAATSHVDSLGPGRRSHLQRLAKMRDEAFAEFDGVASGRGATTQDN